MHLLTGVTIQPNLELKTRPKPVLGSLPLAFALPAEGCYDEYHQKALHAKFRRAERHYDECRHAPCHGASQCGLLNKLRRC